MKKIFSAILLMAAMAFSVSTFVSCNDLAEEMETAQGQIADNAEAIDALEKQVAALETGLQAANAAIAEAKTAAEKAVATAKAEAIAEAKAYADDVLKQAKSYTDAEAKKLQDQITTLVAKVGAIEGNLVTIKTELNDKILAVEKRVADLELQAKTLSAYLKINADGKSDLIEGMIKEIKDLQTLVQTKYDTMKAYVDAEVKKLSDKIAAIDAKLVTLTKALRSLVFVPELYVDGVEGEKYPYADGKYYKANEKGAEGNDNLAIKYVIPTTPKKQKIEWTQPAANAYILPSLQDMYYHLNPSNADVTAATKWAFLAATPDFVESKAAPAVLTPSVEGTPVADKGVLKVMYKVPTPDKLKAPASGHISVAALQATFADYAVTSDYATIIPVTQYFKSLAYTAASKVKTTETCETELYKTAVKAIENAPTVELVYNGGPVDLAKILNIHYTEIFNKSTESAHKNMTLETAAAFYGFNLEFEEISYQSGKNATLEDRYLDLTKEGVVTAQYVDKAGDSQTIAKGEDTTEGRSAIGRRPVVLVKLMDGTKVVLAGYIKLEITELDKRDNITIDKTDPKVPYLCATSKTITWDEMSGQILEYLGLTKNEFVRNYDLEAGQTYVYNAKTEEFDNVIALKKANVYGVIEEVTDANTSTTNDVLTYKLTKANLDAIRALKQSTFTLFARYKAVAGLEGVQPADVYIGIEIAIAENPVITAWGEKVKEAWYPADKDLALRDTVRTNVPAPKTGGDVTLYEKDLEDYFYHTVKDNPSWVKGPAFTLSFDKDAYKTAPAVRYEYVFSKKNVGLEIGGKKLALGANGDNKTLKWDSKDIAVIKGTTLKYLKNDTAKKFLNLYAHNDLTAKHQQYAIIEVLAEYGEGCDIALDFKVDNFFNVRFLRPLDILPNKAAELIDAYANGASVSLGKFFTVQDWRDKDVMVYDTLAKTPAVVLGAKDVIDNGVNLREYYKIEKVKVDYENATCNVTGSFLKINPDVIKLTLTDAAGTVLTVNEVSVKDNLDALNATELNYKNNGGNVQDFTIKVPVTVYYAWGEITVDVPVAVKHTMAN